MEHVIAYIAHLGRYGNHERIAHPNRINRLIRIALTPINGRHGLRAVRKTDSIRILRAGEISEGLVIQPNGLQGIYIGAEDGVSHRVGFLRTRFSRNGKAHLLLPLVIQQGVRLYGLIRIARFVRQFRENARAHWQVNSILILLRTEAREVHTIFVDHLQRVHRGEELGELNLINERAAIFGRHGDD